MRSRDIRRAKQQSLKRMPASIEPYVPLLAPLDSFYKAPADMTDEEVDEAWRAANEPDPTAADVEFLDKRREGQ